MRGIMQRKISETIIAERPLVFLCGPFFDYEDRNDRRTILRISISKTDIIVKFSNKKYDIKPFALIIDQLLNDPNIQKNCNTSLIEEIVASCAYKNYIFLDTMSTALELGLFTNSHASNNAVAMIPNDYKYYSPNIGEFVTMACNELKSIHLIKYTNNRYNKQCWCKKKHSKSDKPDYCIKNLIKFKNHKLPKVINRQILNDFPSDYKKYCFDICFSSDFQDKDKIRYEIEDDLVNFYIPSKILFYLVHKYLNKNEMKEIEKNIFDAFSIYIIKTIPQMTLILYRRFRNDFIIKLWSDFNDPIEDVIRNIDFLIHRLKDTDPNYKIDTTLHVFRYSTIKYAIMIKPSFLDLLLPGYRSMIQKAIQSKEKSLSSKSLIIHGKKRKIITYKANSEGYQLRKIHEEIATSLTQLLPNDDYCFAYKKNVSALYCILKHIDSTYYYKIDIHQFFNSISFNRMKAVLKCHFSDEPEKAYRNTIYPCNCKKPYHTSFFDNWHDISTILQLCYFKNRMPLGLVTSPVLSNYFLYYFDLDFHEKFPDLIYTRYSDDILISSKQQFDKNVINRFISFEFYHLGLTINNEKTKSLNLLGEGSHIKFLGLNIVHKNNGNHITVGAKYIYSLSKELDDYMKYKIGNTETLVGKIQYIDYITKSTNNNDTSRLHLLFSKKTGKDFIVKDNDISFVMSNHE
jgi:DNA-binding MarR family transcriptional regulator